MRQGRRRNRTTALAAAASLLAATAATAQLPVAEPPPQQPEQRPALARVAFEADGAIHTIAADGSDRRRVTERGRDTEDGAPEWSPDGARIAFTRLNLRTEQPLVWVANADGSEARQLTPNVPRETTQSSPTWSPDGERIAFVRTSYDTKAGRGGAALVTVRADGTDERIVHSETTGDDVWYLVNPAWSPSGDRILFTRATFDEEPPDLHVVPAAGGAARRIARNADEGAWAPGGDRIAYTALYEQLSRDACTFFCDGAGEIFVANPDGSGRVRLTNSRADDGAPSWSGDGLRIAFDSNRNTPRSEGAPPELYSMRADGSCVTWLTNGTAHSQEPAFQRGAGLSSDPGGCGAVPREPLVETGMPAEQQRKFAPYWLGRVAPNGLLLTDVSGDAHSLAFGYQDCGRFDPKECGGFVGIESGDLCVTGGLRVAGRRGTRLSLLRGALLQENRDTRNRTGSAALFTHRTRVLMDTASGFTLDRKLIGALRPFPAEQATGGKLPSTRLPASVWRGLRASSRVSRSEASRRRAVTRRLAQLGVKRRLGCSG